MSKRVKRKMKDLRGLNTNGPLITRYPPDGGPAQLFKRKLTKFKKASEERS